MAGPHMAKQWADLSESEKLDTLHDIVTQQQVRSGTPGYNEWVPNFYQAHLKKLAVVPTDDGSQEYQATFIIPRNNATRDLGDFVGQPMMLATKSVQLPLKPQEVLAKDEGSR